MASARLLTLVLLSSILVLNGCDRGQGFGASGSPIDLSNAWLDLYYSGDPHDPPNQRKTWFGIISRQPLGPNAGGPSSVGSHPGRKVFSHKWLDHKAEYVIEGHLSMRTNVLTINGQQFDCSKGNLFLVEYQPPKASWHIRQFVPASPDFDKEALVKQIRPLLD